MSAPALLRRPVQVPEVMAPGWGNVAILMALRERTAAMCDAELRRLNSRVPELDARARDEVGRAVQRVVDAFFGDLGARVARDARHAEALRVLFSLDPTGGRS